MRWREIESLLVTNCHVDIFQRLCIIFQNFVSGNTATIVQHHKGRLKPHGHGLSFFNVCASWRHATAPGNKKEGTGHESDWSLLCVTALRHLIWLIFRRTLHLILISGAIRFRSYQIKASVVPRKIHTISSSALYPMRKVGTCPGSYDFRGQNCRMSVPF